MYDRALNTCAFLFDSIPDKCETEEMCDKVVPEDAFMLKCSHDKYKIQKKRVIKLLIVIY